MADSRDDWKPEDDGDEAGEDELDEKSYMTQKDAIIFAIDVSESMMAPPAPSDSKKPEKDSALSAALKCAYHLMQQRIISNPKDVMGILLFGTEKSKFQDQPEDNPRSGFGYPHCYLFTDLDVPSAEDVRALKTLVEDEEDEDEILSPSSEPVSLSNVLFCANQIFTTKAPNFGSRRLFIITDNDQPHLDDKQAKSAAAVRAKDLYDLGVMIELFPIIQGDKKFDVTKFYDDIIYSDSTGEENLLGLQESKSGDGLTLLSSLLSNINSKQTPKRALFSGVPFEIAPGLSISVKGYNVLHRQMPERSCYIWLDGETPQIATGQVIKMAEDSARTVDKTETKKAYKFGGEYVYFSPEEQKTLKDFGPPIIRILGFKPRSSIPFWVSAKKSTFIFPSEEHFVGSTRVFASLWQKLANDRKVAIAWAITRSNSRPALFAIVASGKPAENEQGVPYLPSGLWMYPLPFADDLRSRPEALEVLTASAELANKMQTIVENLWLPNRMYNPSKYPNPQLQWHYKILQALALQEEVPDKAADTTHPKYRSIAKRVGGSLKEWGQLLSEEVALRQTTKAVKREAHDDEGARGTKRPKLEKKASPKINDAQLKAAVKSGGISKMTVAELKDILASRGQSIHGKKAELVERVEEWLDSNL